MPCGVADCLDCNSVTVGDPLYDDVEENVICDVCSSGKYSHLSHQCIGEITIQLIISVIPVRACLG